MPDLNELLRWSIMNSTAAQQGGAGGAAPAEPAADPANEQMTLRFRPTANPSAASSALHPNDPQYRPPGMPYDEDDSPPSSAGPATPKEGAALLPGTRAPAGPSHLNSEIIDLILGRPDSAVMKEKMEIAMDESRSVDERVEALDDFEMLIEHIDNANNLVVLKMWEPLIALLSSSSPEIVTNALWIIGTSVQNNVKAQAALYQNNVLPRILSLIYPSSASGSSTTSETAATASSSTPSRAVRAKATYAFSAAVKAWPLASAALSTNGYEGYSVLKRGVQDDDVVVRRKMAFLVNTLVLQSEETFEGEMPKEVVEMLRDQAGEVKAAGSLVHGLKAQGVVDALAQGLTQPSDGDLEYEENAMRALSHAAGKGGLSDNVQKQVKGVWEQWGSAGQEERGLSGEDGKAVQALLDGSA